MLAVRQYISWLKSRQIGSRTGDKKMKCVVYQLGLIKYAEAYRLQNQLLEERSAGRIADTILLLEHPPTITVGKSGKLENVLASPAQLAEKGVSLIFIDRGGDATYHGPGQIVGCGSGAKTCTSMSMSSKKFSSGL